MTHITFGTTLIWIDQWEYQCCGNPISTGDVVELTLFETDWPEPWTPALAAPVQLAASHHVPPPESYHLRVRVGRLFEARAKREQRPGDEAWPLIAGSAEVQQVGVMRVWDEDWQPALHGGDPEGWVLDVTVLEELPPRPDDVPYGIDLSPKLVGPDEVDLPHLAPGGVPRTPLLAAWQPAGGVPASDWAVFGHPCIITRADADGCDFLLIGHEGLHRPDEVGVVEDFVQLIPPLFVGRSGKLRRSDWPGFSASTPVATLDDYLELFPEGLPPHLGMGRPS